ncbi:hypothetical protein HOY82DRAFT_2583 [Tuber indicum]|nr:hypothetical protein HOY82DRAFT_2583 [Tuber indicum]
MKLIKMTGMARARFFYCFTIITIRLPPVNLSAVLSYRYWRAYRTCTQFGCGRWVLLWDIIPLTDVRLFDRDSSSFALVRCSFFLFLFLFLFFLWPVVNGVLAVSIPGFFYLLFPFPPSGPYTTGPCLGGDSDGHFDMMGDQYFYQLYSKFPTLLNRKKVSKLNPLPHTHIQRVLHNPKTPKNTPTSIPSASP